MSAPVDACHAIGQADVALGLAGLSEDNIFRKELRAAGVVMAELIDAGNAWCDLMPGLAGGPEFDRLVAALAQVPRKAPTTSMQFTLRQAETLLAFFGGANADMTVEYFPANHWPDNPTAPAGLYVYCTEYPDEGALWLGEENNDEAIEPTWQHIPPAAFGISRVATPDGWKLAMFVLQSDMYHQLPQEERAVCDALVSENPYIAAAPQAGEQVRTVPDDLVLVPRQKIEFAATVLESDGDEYGVGAGLRILLAEAPASATPEVVGHKTLHTPERGFWHEPLFADEAQALWDSIEANDAQRAKVMPSEESAIRLMFEAGRRLKDFGWNDAIYCPKDRSTFQVLEFGSTGKHPCIYEGEWPSGSWWIVAQGDMSPSRPVLWKPLDAAQPEAKS